MNTNKKLALNKHLVANLDSQNMAEVKGGVTPSWTEIIKTIIAETIHLTINVCFSGDAQKGICKTDVWCNGIDNTNGYASCYGGSCGKCG